MMQTIAQEHSLAGTLGASRAGSRRQLLAGRSLSTLAVVFLIFDSAGKLLQVQPVIDGTIQLGYPRDIVFSLGVILLACVVAYVIPRTSVAGAILLTVPDGCDRRHLGPELTWCGSSSCTRPTRGGMRARLRARP